MFILSIVLQSFLILYYVFSGVAKVAGAKYWVEMFEHLELPGWFRVFTGFVQLVGAILLIIGYWVSMALPWACIFLGITMVLACLAHFRVKDPIGKAAPAFVFAMINIILVVMNVNDLL